jgi:putative transposase
MQRVSPYLKMRVLGAIEFAPGKTNVERIKHVATLTFADEADRRFQFTWRTIPTWYSRYKKDGITTMSPKQRSDKGRTRKVEPEAVHEAIEHVRGSFRKGQANLAALYRTCIERGLLVREQVAPNTFRRIVKRHELLKPDPEVQDKRRLAFAKAHANELWQADTLVGPYVQHGHGHSQTRLIAFVDDASRVCCHGEFFFSENTETLILALRSALYKRSWLSSIAWLSHTRLSPKKRSNSIVRSSEGVLRSAKNLCVASLLEAVRDRTRSVDLKQVNRVLLQPHWRHQHEQDCPPPSR